MAVLGNLVSGAWQTYIEIYSTTNTATQTIVYFRYGVYLPKTLSTTFEAKYNTSNRSAGVNIKAAGYHQFDTGSATVNKTHSGFNSSVTYWLTHGGTGSKWKGTSTATQTFWVGAKSSYAVSYNGNKPEETTVEPTNIPANQTQWHGETLTLSSAIPMIDDIRFSFNSWNTSADGSGTAYTPNQPYSGNTALPLYAQWNADYPPSCDVSGSSFTGKTDADGNAIKNFTGMTVSLTNITSYFDGTDEKEVAGIKLVVGADESATVVPENPQRDDDGNYHYDDLDISLANISSSGTLAVKVIITDYNSRTQESKTKEVSLDDITVTDPTWSRTVTINYPPPPIVSGNGVLDSFEVWNYDQNDWETIYGQFPITVSQDGLSWSFTYTFDEDHVSSATSLTPTTKVNVDYRHYTSYEKPYREAFFNTTRNQNFSNGIYNVMFIGGVEDNPNFTSRVWWSQVNNPLYFPDTNYIEVGSNDTMVMGLTKVGDYLAVIKQSKTTDTAIFLVYPTSFEDETTYAVRQGVQGVGALARYSFNILGDETLFLSPKGVMAIVPSQDEEHKVQNRSYFVDGKLLNEPNIDEAYSFVFDGKYWLATGGGAVYVLDGNQRNSWGNDKTNLVYECYCLDNVPAKCFVKYNDRLVFSTDDEVCMVGDGYQDAYGYDDVGELIENAPVKAEWSTILDDDGSLHYYKTMQKKGNLVSVLPLENEQPYRQVFIDEETFNEDKALYFTLVDGKYIRCTEDDVFVYSYASVSVTAEDFNADKTSYYIVSGDEYVQCTEDSVYDPTETYYTKQGTYYVENRTNTKVFVKKDDKDEVEIERTFSLSSSIPSEMFLRKKFKKYKRLQFIVRNDAPEAFGVDSIIKNYTVGNYAKK